MSEIPEEKRNPMDTGPFRIGRLIGRGKREAHPDPNLIKTLVIYQQDTLAVRIRNGLINHNIHIYTFYFLCILLGYEIPAYYSPTITNIVFGMIFGTMIATMPIAYEYEIHRDNKDHRIFINETQIELQESTIGRVKDPKGSTRIVVKGKITRQALYVGRDYQFTGNSPYRIELRDYQTVDNGIGLGKIINASFVDESGRIIIGDQGTPTGLIVKTAFPSRSELSKTIKDAEKKVRNNQIRYEDFMRIKRAYDALQHVQDYVFKMIDKSGIAALDLSNAPKKIKSYFIALDKLSIPWFCNAPKNGLSMEQWEGMDSSIRLPKIMTMWQAYEDINQEVIDLMLTREQDKLEDLAESTLNLADLSGMLKPSVAQAILESRKAIVSVDRKEEKEIQEGITGGEEGSEDTDN